MSKRIFGYINWRRNRGAALSRETVDALTQDIASQEPDHVAVTGDLVNIALAEEYTGAARWLGTLGSPDAVTVVPGNHDAYVPGGREQAIAAWSPFIRSDDGAVAFPLLRRRGAVVLVGVSSAVATPPAFATGTVGREQIEAAAGLFDRHDDAIKLLLIHHPPDLALASGRRRLTDWDQVQRLIAQCGVDVAFHGHTHEPSLRFCPTVNGHCAVLGVPSASSDGSKHPLASYALIDVDLTSGMITATRRGFATRGGPVQRLEALDLRRPARD